MMSRRKSTTPEPGTGPSFEDALAELEAIVDEMEGEQLPLEDLIARYEKGSALLKRCETVLKSARERLELITLRNQDENALDSRGEARQSPAPPPAAAEPDDDDDIRLF
jgi:exodeoxyribonuclease VII small subunit